MLKILQNNRIIGLISDPNQGKSNLLYYIIEELEKETEFNLFTYGLRKEIKSAKKIFSIDELEQIRDSLIIIDEFFSLFDLEDRKKKIQVENTLRLIYHNNNIIILSGVGDNFKKFISSKLDAMIFKKISLQELINGSRVKQIINNYKGYERGTAILNLKIDEAIIFDGKHYHKVKIPYLPIYDTKKENKPILSQKSGEICPTKRPLNCAEKVQIKNSGNI